MTESQNTRKLCRELENLGCVTFAIVGNQMQGSGWPDRYIAFRGWSGWIEFKQEKGKLSKIQEMVIRRLRVRGVNVHVCKYTADGLELEDGSVIRNAKELMAWLLISSTKATT